MTKFSWLYGAEATKCYETQNTDLELVADVEIELELGADLEVVTELEAEMVVQLGQEWKLEIGEFAE
ncbi:hypothetical protein Bca4012_094886 [Brassica carinata]